MPIIKSSQYQFTYDHSRSVNQNFDDWRMLNHEERSAWNESLLTYEESIDVFEAQYSVKVSTKNG